MGSFLKASSKNASSEWIPPGPRNFETPSSVPSTVLGFRDSDLRVRVSPHLSPETAEIGTRSAPTPLFDNLPSPSKPLQPFPRRKIPFRGLLPLVPKGENDEAGHSASPHKNCTDALAYRMLGLLSTVGRQHGPLRLFTSIPGPHPLHSHPTPAP